jgi:hypothetical protein
VNRMKRVPIVGLIAFTSIVAAACAQQKQQADTEAAPAIDTSLVGIYNCSPGGGAPAEDVIELKEDGKLTITQGGTTGEGTWSARGKQGAFKPEGQGEDPFTIEGDRLVFGGGSYCDPKINAALVGSYNCVDPGPPGPPGVRPPTLELRADGTASLTLPSETGEIAQTRDGAWSADEDSGMFTVKVVTQTGSTPKTIKGENNPFSVEGDRLKFTKSEWSECSLG